MDLPEGTRCSTFTAGGRKKMHYTMPDGAELIEEDDISTDVLKLRKRRAKSMLGAQTDWVYEVGEPPERVTIENETLRPSAANPTLARNDRPHAWEWRVRNLPYPKPTYSVTLDLEQRQVVVRTSNKKYYKRLDIPEMDRHRLPLDEKALSWMHENSTLIVLYKKPEAVLRAERAAKLERARAESEVAPPGAPALQDDSPECKQQ